MSKIEIEISDTSHKNEHSILECILQCSGLVTTNQPTNQLKTAPSAQNTTMQTFIADTPHYTSFNPYLAAKPIISYLTEGK